MSQPSPAPQGPVIADHEDLYRVLTKNEWCTPEDRVSSAAFSYPRVSTDVVSIADSQGLPAGQFTLARFPGAGLVILNAGVTKTHGGDPRLEPEEGNPAHAHIYMPATSNSRKKTQRKLADSCQIIQRPNLP